MSIDVSEIRLDYYTTLRVDAELRRVNVKIDDYRDGTNIAALNVKQAEQLVTDLQKAIKVAKGEIHEEEL